MNTSVDLKTTIGKGCEEWLYRTKQLTVKKGSFTRLLTSFKMMMDYPIAYVRLIDLKTQDIQNYVNTLADKGYAVTTIKKQFNLLSGYLRYLVGDGVPIRPAYINVHLPVESEVRHKKKEVVAYTMPEQKRLRKVCDTNWSPGSIAIVLMTELGLRIGELIALQWDDIQWERKAVHIHRTAVNHNSVKSMVMQDSPKSHASDRVLPLSTVAYTTLERLADEADDLNGLVLSFNGQSVGYPVLRTQVSHICEEANVKYLGMHIFRHTFATNCYYRGVDIKRLSRFLGHGSVTVTYNTYVHLYGDTLEELRCVVS